MTKNSIPIAVAYGDGIGPEIMAVTLEILKEAGVVLDIHEVKIGEEVYLAGHKTGIAPETWTVLQETEAFLKAPITTPQGGGFKSLNVTIRGAFGLYANVRPCVSYHPFIENKHPGMDVVIIRENEEDLYTGIEYKQTPDVTLATKIISRSGCERIIRYAFEYARANGRKKVTCFTKDNILKITDGLFHAIFEEIAKEYPEIENEHWIIDIGAAKLADTPNAFDVVVMPNLYGDILSDVSAQIAGSVGLAGSANIGEKRAMFEAIHGSAPRRADQNLANPSGLLFGSLMMLQHLGLVDASALIQNAWLKTIEEGIHTYDIHSGTSTQKVGTKEFGKAIIERLGKTPETLKAVVANHKEKQLHHEFKPASPPSKMLDGFDIYIEWADDIDTLVKTLQKLCFPFRLTMITSRGTKLWPEAFPEMSRTDHLRCRFIKVDAPSSHRELLTLLQKLEENEIDFVQTQNLCSFNREPSYSQAHEH